MRWVHTGSLFAWVVLGCGPESVEHADLDELCGEPSPVRVLPLEDDVAPIARWGSVRVFDDRILAIVGAAVSTDDRDQYGHAPVPEHTRVISVGTCGEDPRTIAEDVYYVFEDEHAPGLLFGRTGSRSGDVVVLDPSGARPPETFALDVDATDAWGDLGIVTQIPHGATEGEVAVWLRPYPSDPAAGPAASILLFEGITASPFGDVVLRGNEVFARRPGGEVEVFDLVDGGIDTALTGAQRFDVSEDGRWLYWEEQGDDANDTHGAYVGDRSTGTQTQVGDAVDFHGWPSIRDGYAFMALDPDTGFSERLVALPSLVAYDVPAAIILGNRLPDGRWLGYRGIDELVTYDLESGELRTIYRGATGFGKDGPEGTTEILPVTPVVPIDFVRVEGPLWRVRYQDGERVRLAQRVTPNWTHLADDRVVTVVDVGGSYLGDLVVVEPHTLDEQLVDDHVFAAAGELVYHLPDEDDTLLYAVRDGDRSGLWRTQVAPSVR